MNRSRALIVSLAVAVAAIGGVVAVGKTAALGAQTRSTSTSDTEVARRTAQLDRYEASLHKALVKRPPPLPDVPAGSQASSTLQSALPAKVVYRRPAPVVVVTPRAGGEGAEQHESEHELEGAEADD